MNLHITDHRISAAVKLGAEKKSGLNEIRLNPWPPPYQCSVLPTELSSQLGDHRKVYITVKLIKCGIRRKNYFKNLISCGLEQTSFQTHNWQCLLIWVTCCVFTTTVKQTETLSISRWQTTKGCEAFLMFLLVADKIYFGLDESDLPIFVTREGLRGKLKYLRYQKSLAH